RRAGGLGGGLTEGRGGKPAPPDVQRCKIAIRRSDHCARQLCARQNESARRDGQETFGRVGILPCTRPPWRRKAVVPGKDHRLFSTALAALRLSPAVQEAT